MRQEEEFDSFYRATRLDLLHQTFALTGDLAAAQSAVRDAYVAAWHHWRKVSGYDDVGNWVRPRAWRLAQRRHTARLWHRTKGLGPGHKAVLDALHKLPGMQRRVLLLVELARLPVDGAARELGLAPDVTRTHFQTASAHLQKALETDATGLRMRLLTLGEVSERSPLPRPSILRREGRKRRRSHTLIAGAVVTFLAVGSGALAHEPAGRAAPEAKAVAPPAATESGSPEPRATLPSAADLLRAGDLEPIAQDGQEWRVTRTHSNTAGSGINTVCQAARFADPHGLAAMVREFDTRMPRRTAVQSIEISGSEARATDAYATARGWYSGCPDGELQLLRAYDVAGLGDRANVFTFRSWTGPATHAVALARVGQVLTTTAVETARAEPPRLRGVVRTLATSVRSICERAGRSDCDRRPRVSAVAPPPSGEEPGILAEVDLPPIGLKKPWVGTKPAPARNNPSATTCDRASFVAEGARRTRTRTFLVPGARLPARFGLTESYGDFRDAKAAMSFLATVRGRFARCEDRDLATDVRDPQRFRDRAQGTDGSTWTLVTEISDAEAVVSKVGLVRVGSDVAHVTFFPAEGANLSGTEFRAMLLRAADRLRELD